MGFMAQALPALGVCGVVALVVGAKAGLLPAALAVGYGATAASLLALLALLGSYYCTECRS